jgi:hypothetical protein
LLAEFDRALSEPVALIEVTTKKYVPDVRFPTT